MNLQADINRAEHAQRLLDDELLQETLDAIEREVVKAWGECPQRDKEAKEAYWQLYRTSQKFRDILRGYVETGKLATSNLKHFEKERGLLRRVIG